MKMVLTGGAHPAVGGVAWRGGAANPPHRAAPQSAFLFDRREPKKFMSAHAGSSPFQPPCVRSPDQSPPKAQGPWFRHDAFSAPSGIGRSSTSDFTAMHGAWRSPPVTPVGAPVARPSLRSSSSGLARSALRAHKSTQGASALADASPPSPPTRLVLDADADPTVDDEAAFWAQWADGFAPSEKMSEASSTQTASFGHHPPPSRRKPRVSLDDYDPAASGSEDATLSRSQTHARLHRSLTKCKSLAPGEMLWLKKKDDGPALVFFHVPREDQAGSKRQLGLDHPLTSNAVRLRRQHTHSGLGHRSAPSLALTHVGRSDGRDLSMRVPIDERGRELRPMHRHRYAE